MNDNIEKILSALVDAVDKLKDQPTGEAIAADPKNAFRKTPAQEDRDKNKALAKEISEANAKETEQAEKEKGRKITKEIMPVSIVGIDKKALAALADIIPKVTEKAKEEEKPKKEGGDGLLKKLGLGALALVIAPIVAMVNMFKEIGKQKWFLKLKDFVKNSKLGQSIGKIIANIQKAFTSIGKRFPVVGKLMANLFGKGGSLTGLFSKIKTLGSTVMNLLKQSKILSVAAKVGKLLGKLFLPITILWGTIETVMGAVKGYKEDGVAGSIKGGVNALFDFLVVDLVNLIVSIPAWFLKKIGLKNVAKALQGNVDGVLQSVKDMFGGIVDTVVGVFTLDPERIMKGLKGMWEGQKDFVGFAIGLAVDPIINFLKDVFKFGDPDSPFSFKKDVLDPAVNKIKKWFKGLLSLGKTEDGTWSLSLFINNVEKKIIEFFTGMFTWAKETGTNEEGEWSLLTFIDGVFESVKSWFTGLFNWEEVSKKILVKVDWLKTIVTDTWNSVKQWFVDLVTWSETDTDESGQKDGFIVSTIKGLIKSVSTYFSKLFTFDSTSKAITSIINIATWLPNLVVSGLAGISAWFLKLFGFDEEAKDVKDWSDKFSIGDLIVGAVSSAWTWLKEKFLISANYITEKWNALTGAAADIGTWLYNSTIKPITDWFDKLFTDPKGTMESLLPPWMIDVAGWLYTNAFAPISDWFTTLFDDPAGTFKALLPPWMLDIGNFFYNNLVKPIADIFEGLMNIDFKTIVKDKIKGIPVVGEKIYNHLFGEGEALAEAQNKEAAKQAENLAKAGMGADAAKMVAEARLKARDDRGGDNMVETGKKYEDRLESMIADGKKLADSHYKPILMAMEKGGHGFLQSKFAKEVYAKTGGSFDASNKKHQEILKKHLAQVKDSSENSWTSDQMKDEYDESMRLLSVAAAQQDYSIGLHNDTVKATMAALKKTGGIQLGDEHLRFFDKSPITGTMIAELQKMFNDKSDDKLIIVEALKKLGITPENLEKSSRFQSNEGVAQDFIWRPGQEPMRFSKGDIVMGMHQDVKPPSPNRTSGSSDESTRQLVNNSRELVTRMDSMVTIMNQHSEIHGRILEVLTEAGLMDKQGNTVVNNGGNSTVTNITTQQSSIMDFRDNVVGRINNSTTK